MEVKKTKDLFLKKFNALVYGKSGTGKTMSIATLKGETLIVAVERGLLTLSDYDIDNIEPDNWDDLLNIYIAIRDNKLEKKYDNIVIDGITEANEFCKKHILFKERPQVKGVVGKVYDDILTLQDYGLLQIKMERMVTSFISLPQNIIFTALEDIRKDENTGYETVVPSLNGKLALSIGKYFDFVFRLFAKKMGDEVVRNFVTAGDEGSIGKDRSRELDRLEETNWSKIIDKIKEKKKKKETKKKGVSK